MRKIIIAIIAFILIISVTFLYQNNTKSLVEKSTYENILSEKNIKAGFISYSPNFIYGNPHSGIGPEVLDIIAKKLNIQVQYAEEFGWGSMIEGLKSNKVDLIATPIWPTTERGKYVNFSDPLFYNFVNAYVKIGGHQFTTKESINSPTVTIAIVDGEMSSIIASTDFPKAKISSLTQMNDVSQLLLMVAEGKADITFVEPSVALEYMQNNPGKIQKLEIEPLRIFPNVFAVPKGDIDFLQTLNIAITEMHNNGDIERILEKYEKFPNSFFRVETPVY